MPRDLARPNPKWVSERGFDRRNRKPRIAPHSILDAPLPEYLKALSLKDDDFVGLNGLERRPYRWYALRIADARCLDC